MLEPVLPKKQEEAKAEEAAKAGNGESTLEPGKPNEGKGKDDSKEETVPNPAAQMIERLRAESKKGQEPPAPHTQKKGINWGERATALYKSTQRRKKK